METASPVSANLCPALPPRFSVGRRMGRGLVVCLWLWTSVQALTAASEQGQDGWASNRLARTFSQGDLKERVAAPDRRASADGSGIPTFINTADAAGFPPNGPGTFSEQDGSVHPVVATGPGVMAKPRRSRNNATPTPSSSPTQAPDGTTANQGASPTPASPAPVDDGASGAASAGKPAASPSPEFTQRYEAAYVKFLEKDYPGTLALLEEADKIQAKQPQSATLRAQVFKQDYEAAYLAFRKLDYPAALGKLDEADLAQPNYPDALNLRGLIYSKQRVYDRAEGMFKRAVEADPTLWAAKFNYAELPFNRGDYTTARGRFEDLLAETDAVKRPREAELTQYKVFLTLLMEGKTDQARSFMDHFNFSGATPAKYFCNAAMNFRAGTVDKAETWINSAKREYPAQLVSIFLESFYRLGWMTDPNTPGTGTALAAASPPPAASPAVEAVTASVTPGPSPTKVAVAATPVPAVSATPILLAAASPTVAPAATVNPTPSPTATPVSSVPPASTPTKASPTGTAQTASAPTPAATVGAAQSSPSANGAAKQAETSNDDILRYGLVGAVLLYGLYVFFRVLGAAKRRKARRAQPVRTAEFASDKPAVRSEKVETPR